MDKFAVKLLDTYGDAETNRHAKRVSEITGSFLRTLVADGTYSLSEQEIRNICAAALLHDIGKCSIPGHILKKEGQLSEAEKIVVRKHTENGAFLLSRYGHKLAIAAQVCRWHHERWDGKGYPDGLSGREIPFYIQIVSWADVYDALTSTRCYKVSYDSETVMRMIQDGACGKFNPQLLQFAAKFIKSSPHGKRGESKGNDFSDNV